MLRYTTTFALALFLIACESDDSDNSGSHELTLEQYQQLPEDINSEVCEDLDVSELDNRILTLNTISESMFATNGVSAVNGYATLLSISQLDLLFGNSSTTLLESSGLSNISNDDQWHNTFCQLEKSQETNSLRVNVMNDWLIKYELLNSLEHQYNGYFISKNIDPTTSLKRLELTNYWSLPPNISIGSQSEKYVQYQLSSHSTVKISDPVAKTIKINGNISSATTTLGTYYSYSAINNININIIMPTFEQYDYVKDNIASVISEFKAEELTQLTELLVPYFSAPVAESSFMKTNKWLSQSLFANEYLDFSGVNTIEAFTLINNDYTNSFNFNELGEISAFTDNSMEIEATSFVIEAFPELYAETLSSSNYSGSFSMSAFLDNGHWIYNNNATFCNEPLQTEAVWRPYFIILENAQNGLIYSIAANETPEFEAQPDNLCVELL